MASALASTVMLIGFFYVLFGVALALVMLTECWRTARAGQLAAVARSRAARGAGDAGSGRPADSIAA